MNGRPTYGTGFARNAWESANPELWRGIVGLWSPFLGPTGVALPDWSANRNNGIWNGSGVHWGAGSAQFTAASSDYVDLNNMDVAGGNGISILVWAKADSFPVNDVRMVSKADSTSAADHYWMLGTINVGHELRSRLKTGGTTHTLAAASDGISVGEPFFAAMTYDGDDWRIYKNGSEVALDGSKSGVVDTDNTINSYIGVNTLLGGGGLYGHWDGTMDQIIIYNRGLLHAEIIAFNENQFALHELAMLPFGVAAAAAAAFIPQVIMI